MGLRSLYAFCHQLPVITYLALLCILGKVSKVRVQPRIQRIWWSMCFIIFIIVVLSKCQVQAIRFTSPDLQALAVLTYLGIIYLPRAASNITGFAGVLWRGV
jgi:hypothetical protein